MKDTLSRALGYPYAVPDTSYVLDGGRARRVRAADVDLTDRHPVLASGSNQAPDQLACKFGDDHADPIPVLEAHVDGMDAVYSAHFSSYGALPATLAPAPGVRVRLFVTWLTDGQLDRMHETEALGMNYEYLRLDGLAVVHDGARHADHAFAYNSLWGALDLGDGPVALSEIPAVGRAGPVLSQRAVQKAVHARLGPDVPFEDFVVQNATDADLRVGRTLALVTAPGGLP